MPKTQKDPIFTKAVGVYVKTACNGNVMLAGKMLGAARQHIYKMRDEGKVPTPDRKERMVAIMIEAGCHPKINPAAAPTNVIKVTEKMTQEPVDASRVADVLKFLLDLVEGSGSVIKAQPASPQGQEVQS